MPTQYSASVEPNSSAMKENIISPSDAALLIDRWVKQSIPLHVWFVSGDGAMKIKILGYVSSLTQEIGIAFTTRSPDIPPEEDSSLPVFLTVSRAALLLSKYRYTDETELPADFALGSGMRIDLPDGGMLTIGERRDTK